MNYITKDNTIIYAPSFNDELDNELLNNYKKIIFSDYNLNDGLFDAYDNYDFKYFEYQGNCFNQMIYNLPS